jgi:hypothetical protein
MSPVCIECGRQFDGRPYWLEPKSSVFLPFCSFQCREKYRNKETQPA